MKKLMIIAAAVMAVVGAKAAAIDWTASKIVDPWASAEAGSMKPANTWLGYVVLAADYQTVTTDLAAGNTATLLSKAVGPEKLSSTKGAFSLSTPSGSVAAGEQTFYLIVLNSGTVAGATHFFASDSVVANVDASLDTAVGFGSQQTKSADMGNWTAVAPEPTSGLLLLIGCAGLALRRRRA